MTPVIFFDGDCAFCSRSVNWIATHDNGYFAFAPLGGRTFRDTMSEDARAGIPDTIVIRTAAGGVLMKGRAVRHALQQARWPWRVLGWPLAWIPASWLDAAYDIVAKYRHHVAGDVCPVPSADFRRRVLE